MVDQNLWGNHPITWRVPVKDLLAVYHRMGKDQYTADEIIRGNQLLSLAGLGERFIALPAYPYLLFRMPWTANNYYSWPQGGISMNVQKAAEYQINLWQRIKNKSTPTHAKFAVSHKNYFADTNNAPTTEFAKMALETGAVNVATKSNDDGSVEIAPPVINQFQKLQELAKHFLDKLTK